MKENYDVIIEDETNDLLMACGIPANIQGYKFLKTAVILTVHDPEILQQVTKRLYPTVASICNSTSQIVERCIRHSITKAFESESLFRAPDFDSSKNIDLTGNHCNSNVIALFAQAISRRVHDRDLNYQRANEALSNAKKIQELKNELDKYKRIYGELK